MPNSYDIREFDCFVDQSFLDQTGVLPDESHIALEHSVFEALEAFILENRNTGSEPLELMSLGARRGFGKTITARNYVGTIAFNDGTTIQVLPKLAVGDDAKQERRVFLRMLQAVVDLPMKEFDLASLSTARIGIMEPFISMFSKTVSQVAKRGLRGAYVVREGNERFLKGKVDFGRTVKLNAAHAERLFVRYDEFAVNRPENRLIRTTLELLKGKTHSLATKRDIDMTLSLFVDVPASSDVDRDFSKCMLDRTMGSYLPILTWSRVFLKGEGFTSFKGSTVASSLLFPMETLFEAYVAREVRKAAARIGWRASVQDKGRYLYNEPRRFRLRPDIVLRKEGERPVVLDTKWKRIGGAVNDGMSQADMYQMYSYQRRYDASKSILVYPRHDGVEAGFRSEYISRTGDSLDALTRVFVFDLMNAETSTDALVDLAVAHA